MSFLTGSPFIWDKTKRGFIFNPKMYLVINWLNILCVSFHLTQISLELYNLSKKESGMGDAAIFGPLFIIAFLACLQYTDAMIRNINLFQGFINELVKLESESFTPSEQAEPEDKLMLKMAKYICLLIREVLIRVSPFALSSAAAAFPTMYMNLICYPPGQYLIQLIKFSIPNEVIAMVASRLFLFVVNYWTWLVYMKLGAIVIIQIVIGTVGLTQLIKQQWK